VDDDQLERIFEPFYRVDTARKSGSGEHGIGLSLAHAIMDVHGGSILAFNVEPHGLGIRMRLPAR
jgi:two-component system sensor histidine kinase CpxA